MWIWRSEEESELEMETVKWSVVDVNQRMLRPDKVTKEVTTDREETSGLSPGELQHEEVVGMRRNRERRSSLAGHRGREKARSMWCFGKEVNKILSL